MPILFGREVQSGMSGDIDMLAHCVPFGGAPITKYCDETTYRSLLSGEIRLGTHEKYSNAAATNALMSDCDEGISLNRINQLDRPITIGGIRFSGNRGYGIEPGGIAFGIAKRVNFFIFCASCGSYDRSHHRVILKGNENYPGNPGYDHYVVFDALRLAQAICDYVSRTIGECGLVIGLGDYNDREFAVDPYQPDYSFLATQKAIFSKPERLVDEREFRIAIEVNGGAFGCGRDGLPVKSEAIAGAIIDPGGSFGNGDGR